MPSATAGGVALELRDVSHLYGSSHVLESVNLKVDRGQFIAIVGPSGGGKTTLLNIVAGFIAPTRGDILFNDSVVTRTPVHRRNLGVVFQSYALFPHMTALENVVFPLAQRKIPRPLAEQRAQEALGLVGLGDRSSHRPSQLSGGQQQRVALARAIVHRPGLLLMDEPMGALERSLRVVLQEEIRRIHQDFGMTVLYVTHNAQEALELADVIAVIRDGRLEQCGTPDEVWTRPATRFAARALGDCNVIEGHVRSGEGFVPHGGRRSYPVGGHADGGDGGNAALLIRPERMSLYTGDRAGPAGNDYCEWEGKITRIDFSGSTRRVYVADPDMGTVSVTELASPADELEVGRLASVRWRVADSWLVFE